MHFFTWSNTTTQHPHYHLLIQSAQKQGLTLTPIGTGQDFSSYLCKLKWLQDAIQDLPKTDLVLCTDANDVLYLRGQSDIEKKFLALGANIVYAGERWPSHQNETTVAEFNQVHQLSGSTSAYKFINSGTVMGYVWALQDMLTTISTFDLTEPGLCCCLNNTPCDQSLLARFFAHNPGKIKIDYDTELFWCTSAEWHELNNLIRIREGVLYNTTTQNAPCVLHIPAKEYADLYQQVAQQLFKKLASSS